MHGRQFSPPQHPEVRQAFLAGLVKAVETWLRMQLNKFGYHSYSQTNTCIYANYDDYGSTNYGGYIIYLKPTPEAVELAMRLFRAIHNNAVLLISSEVELETLQKLPFLSAWTIQWTLTWEATTRLFASLYKGCEDASKIRSSSF